MSTPLLIVPTPYSNEQLGGRIREVRRRLKKSQEEFARALGAEAGQAQVSKWERGHVRPSPETLEAIAELAGLPLEEFAGLGELAERREVAAAEGGTPMTHNHGADDGAGRSPREWVGEMIQLVVTSSLNERWKVALAAEVAAAARGEAAVIEARAAERRAAAMERAEGAAETRATSGQRAEEAAEARAWLLGLSSEGGEGGERPVVPAVPPGEGRRLLQRFLEELQQAETQHRRASGDPRT